MKKATVQITYPAEKLEAIRHYMGGKDTDMNTELEDALGKIYLRIVPKEVRGYLEVKESMALAKPPRPARPTPASPGFGMNFSQGVSEE